MGGKSTKLRKHLQNGDEHEAIQLCKRYSERRTNFDPNLSYGEQFNGNTPLTYAAQHAMKLLILSFLNEMSGDPNIKNDQNASCAHLICQIPNNNTETVNSSSSQKDKHLEHEDDIRAECLEILLSWRSKVQKVDEKTRKLNRRTSKKEKSNNSDDDNSDAEEVLFIEEKLNISSKDIKEMTPLHHAASNGLMKCVRILVAHGANLTSENDSNETACDIAERRHHLAIADFLESHAIFQKDGPVDHIPKELRDDTLNDDGTFNIEERYVGLHEQDIIDAKDTLLVETSDLLQVPLFTAEALLRTHEWSRDTLSQSWQRDAVAACERAGVAPTASAVAAAAGEIDLPLEEIANTEKDRTDSSATITKTIQVCGICSEEFSSSADLELKSDCEHFFCHDCWKSYVTSKITAGESQHIHCPAFDCSQLVPISLISHLVTPRTARRYLTFDLRAFVDSNPRIQWCPYPECPCAVGLPLIDEGPPMYMRMFPKLQPPPPTSRAVVCPKGHTFCWQCRGAVHEPTCCEKWKEWLEKIKHVKPDQMRDTSNGNESAASCLWLVTHSKPCPKCKSPIQRNDGCNHMKCTKCKQDFCWVCLGPWKRHGTETGGYFRCNRYDDSRKVEEKSESAILQAKVATRKAQELSRFVHYYSRFKNHQNALQVEKHVMAKLPDKLVHIGEVAKAEGFEKCQPEDLEFIESAMTELIRSRTVLSSSYAYGYYLKDCGYNKTIFEYLQNELETTVDGLSSLVGRSYVRGSRQRVILMAQYVASRRSRFILCICRGLVPPETPPHARKNKYRIRLPAIVGLDKDCDECFTLNGDATPKKWDDVEGIDKSRPWVRDKSGRHHNAYLQRDWPPERYSSDDESPLNNCLPNDFPSRASGSAVMPLVCMAPNCHRPRVRNPHDGTLHDTCSLRCANASANKSSGATVVKKTVQKPKPKGYNMDRLIEVQKLRMKLLEDLKQAQRKDSGQSSFGDEEITSDDWNSQLPPVQPPMKSGLDPQLQLAVEKSLRELQNADNQDDVEKRTLLTFVLSLTAKDTSSDQVLLANKRENVLRMYPRKTISHQFSNITTDCGSTAASSSASK